MGLQRQADLHNTPAQEDQTHSADKPKDEIGQVAHNGERVTGFGGKGGGGQRAHDHNTDHGCNVAAETTPGLGFQVLVLLDGDNGMLFGFHS